MRKNPGFNIGKSTMILVVAVIALIMIKCKPVNEKNIAVSDATSTDTKLVPVSETSLPDAPGADAFRMNCMICHSERYVQMQPEFSKQTWEKIVDKMIKSYGAPIADSTAQNIVGYLTIIKGKK